MQERPTSILGLTLHAARARWQALTPRARTFAIAAGTFFVLAAATAGVHATQACSAHCGGCPAARSECPHAHH